MQKGSGMLSLGSEGSDECVKVKHGKGHCWLGGVATGCGGRRSGTIPQVAWVKGGTAQMESIRVVTVCKIMNRKCQHQHVDRIYSPSFGCCTILSSPVSSESVSSPCDYLLVVLY